MNVYEFIDRLIRHEIQLNSSMRAKIDGRHYFAILQKKYDRFVLGTDFYYEIMPIFPEELKQFTEQQKQEIDEYIRIYCQNEDDCFIFALHLMAKILSDFSQNDATENTTFEAIRQTYEYVKQQWKTRFPEQFELFQKMLNAKLNQKSEKQDRPVCVDCGSSHVVSSGLNWLCQTCARQFRKKPRKRHYNVNETKNRNN